MNVKIINRRYCPGEAWTNRVLAYAKGLSELGCNVTLIYLITDAKRTPYKIEIPGVKVIDLWEKDCLIARKFRPLSFLFNLYKLKSYIRQGDKVFVYNAEKYILNSIKKTGADLYAEITEHPYIYNKKGANGERVIDKQSRKLNILKGLCVISCKLKDYFTSIGISEDKLTVVNMFVDSSRFKGIVKTANEPYIAYCGTISYDKDGVNILIDSFRLFQEKHPEYKLMIIGRGMTPTIIDELKQKVTEIGLKDKVVFTGQILSSEMPSILVNARILALARPNNLQAQNGFPTKLGEYLATGNPVVVTKVGEIPNFIHHMENGFLAEPDNASDFAENLLWVADHYEDAKKIGMKGQLLSDNCFSYLSQSRVLFNLMQK